MKTTTIRNRYQLFMNGLLVTALMAGLVFSWPRPVSSVPAHSAAGADLAVYTDTLAPGWEDWSWLSTIVLDNGAPVHSGVASIAITHKAADAGFSARYADQIDTTTYTAIHFWAHGGTVARQLVLYTQSTDDTGESLTKAITLAPNVWQEISVPLADLGSPPVIKRINLQNDAGPINSAYYVDELSLSGATTPATLPDATADRVLGQTLLTTNAAGSTTSQLHGPAGVAIAPDGRLYVADYENHRVLSWPDAAAFSSGQAAQFSIGGFGTGRNQLSHPESVVVDSAGNLFVADTDNQRVVVYNTPVSDGAADVVFGAADPDDCFGANNDATAADFCYPRGLAFDNAGNLYVADEYHHRIKVYKPPFADGMSASDVLGQSDLTKGTAGDLQGPRGVAIDSQDHLFVADSEHNRVVVYDSPRISDKAIDQELKPLNFPIDLAVDQYDRLYVSDLNSHRVVVYADPRNSAAISAPVYGATLANNDCDSTPDPAGIAATATSLHCPLGLAVDSAGNLYVADFDNNRVLAFDAPDAATPTHTPTPTDTATPTLTPLPDGVIALAVDAAAARKPISPYIYGLNFAKESFAKEIALPLRRWGGNATTRYNWQTGNTNHAADWFFHNNVNYDAYTGAAQTADQWRAGNKATGAASLITLPMVGYVAKNGNQATCGFSVAKYGPQDETNTDDGFPDCGNGLHNGQPIVADPLDTSSAVDENFVAGWVNHIQQNAATNGPVHLYALDNEPDIWFETHRDVAPTGWKYDEFRDLSFRYGAAVKAADPAAQLFGPVVNGWTYYWHGAYDGQREDWASPDDRNAHGGTPFLEWYLQQMAAYEQTHGVRLLDYLDVHFYPQNGVDQSLAGSAAKQALRLRSTRALWDPTYVDESWIADAGPDGGIVKLIPRLHAWVNANYPGTKLALTEYNWGGLEAINGALAQADILGIFGREGLDAAALWNYPTRKNNAGEAIKYDIFETLPGAYAFRIYRNYDGQGSQFGDISVQATSSDPSKLAVYAAQRNSDNALTVVVINKTGGPLSANLSIANLSISGSAEVYRYSGADLNAIQRLADQPVVVANAAVSFPANSITLWQIPASNAALTATPTPTVTATSTQTLVDGSTSTPTPTPTATVTPIMTVTTPPAGDQSVRAYLPLVTR